MAWTQGDIDLLKTAIAERKGARSITFSDQTVTFGSVEEMLTLLSAMKQDVVVSQGRSTSRVAVTSKGF